MILVLVCLMVGCYKQPSDAILTETPEATLTIYTSHPSDLIYFFINEFEERTNIKVKIISGSTGVLLRKIGLEKNNPQADIMWGGGVELLNHYIGNFQPYRSPHINNISDEYYDENYRWSGESLQPIVFLYNTTQITQKEVPTSWADLLDSSLKGRIAYSDPWKSESSYTILSTINKLATRNLIDNNYLEKFHNSLDNRLLSSSAEVYNSVAKGEFMIGLTLEKEAAKLIRDGHNVNIVYPEEGTALVLDGVVIIKGAKHLDEAKKFLDFLLDPTTQLIASKQLHRRSVITDSEPPVGLNPQSALKTIEYNLKNAGDENDLLLQEWDALVKGQE